MTFHAGFGPRLAAVLVNGNVSFDLGGVPHVMCDGCGVRQSGESKRKGYPLAWLLRNTAPNGWLLVRRENEDGSLYRRDYCKRCRVKP